ncbi:MAG: hypothetical protein FJ390_05590 [Verrucomicrobia bacterium]|nr:hypothetical protein [Verrucomicrobiota bacterium]
MMRIALPRLFQLFLFLLLLQTPLFAWPMRQAELGEEGVNQSKSNPRNNPVDIQTAGERSFEERSNIEEDRGLHEIPISSGDFIGVPVQSLKNVSREHVAEQFSKILEKIREKHPDRDIVAGIVSQKASPLSYDQSIVFKKDLIETLPDNVREPFEEALAMARELKTQGKNEDATSLMAQAYGKREQYLKQQLKHIEDMHQISYGVNSARLTKELLQQAEEIAAKIHSITHPVPILGSLLNYFFSSDPNPLNLIKEFKKATSNEGRSAALDKIKKLEWSVNFAAIDKLTARSKIKENYQNRENLLSSLETIAKEFPLPIKQKQQNEKAEKVLELPVTMEWLALSDVEARIQEMAPNSNLLKSVYGTDGVEKIALDYNAVKQLIDENEPNIIIQEGSSLEEAKLELQKNIFRLLGENISFKFRRVSKKLTSLEKLQERDDSKPSELNTRLECMALFLGMDMVTMSDNSVPEYMKNWAQDTMRNVYPILKRANDFIDEYTVHFSEATLSEDPEALNKVRELLCMSHERRLFEYELHSEGIGRVRSAIMELRRAVRDQVNEDVASYHLQSALLLMQSASEANHHPIEVIYPDGCCRKGDNSESLKLRQAAELYAMAAYLKRKPEPSSRDVGIGAEDRIAEDYAALAQRVLAGEKIDDYEVAIPSAILRRSEQLFYKESLRKRLEAEASRAQQAGDQELYNSIELRLSQIPPEHKNMNRGTEDEDLFLN